MERRCFRKCSMKGIYIYIPLYIYIHYKQNTITNPYRLFHPLEGSSGGPYPNRYIYLHSCIASVSAISQEKYTENQSVQLGVEVLMVTSVHLYSICSFHTLFIKHEILDE